MSSLGYVLSGCSGGAASNTTSSASGAAKPADSAKQLKIGMVFDSGGRGDKSFNDSAYAGLERAQKELGVQIMTVDSKSEKDYETNLQTLAEQGYDLVLAIGITQANALNTVAPAHPSVKFAIVDADVTAPNVRSLKFAEEQGSYLAGVAAALASTSGKVGFVGGKKIDLILKFEAGFAAGAKATKPDIVILPGKYTESWDDVTLGKSLATSLFKEGADVVYHASGRCGVGVIDAAAEAKKLAIGVDSNQDDLKPGFVLTSMIKRVDQGVFQTIADLKDGKFSAETKEYDLKSNGVGLSDFKHTKDKVGAEGMAKIQAAKKAIVEGTISVPKTLSK